jgi:RecB family exonuclease
LPAPFSVALLTAVIEEQEQRIQLGLDFHRMVQRYLAGIPETFLRQNLHDDDLERWWRNFMVYRPHDLPGESCAELTLTVPVAGHRLVAKYDLIVIEAGKRMTILDWKTTHLLPRVSHLQQRMQTKVYRYVLTRAGTHLNKGTCIEPTHVEMIYWFPEHPDSPVRLPYTFEQYGADERVITQIIEEIKGLDESAFRLTTDTRRCLYCSYRTYCGTTNQVGTVETYTDEREWQDEESINFDFEQISEIEF